MTVNQGESGGTSSVKQAFQMLAGDNVQVLQGIVQSPLPNLKIQITNDAKLIITQNNTSVPWHLTDYETKCEIEDSKAWRTEKVRNPGDAPAHENHDHEIKGVKAIKILNALKPGELVHVLSYNHGKSYYVIDRVKK